MYGKDSQTYEDFIDDLDHFTPELYPGSDHESVSDNEMVSPLIYESDGEEDEIIDSGFFANVEKNRRPRLIGDWCSCQMKCALRWTQTENVFAAKSPRLSHGIEVI